MSKEEVLDMWAKDKMLDWDIYKFQKTHPSLYAVILQAMSSYSKQEAIGFSNWMDFNEPRYKSGHKWFVVKSNAEFDHPPKTYELYQLYLNSKEQQ